MWVYCEQVHSLESCQLDGSKAQLMNQKLKVKVDELEAQLNAAHDVREKMLQEKNTLESDLDILRAVNKRQRLELTDRTLSFGNFLFGRFCIIIIPFLKGAYCILSLFRFCLFLFSPRLNLFFLLLPSNLVYKIKLSTKTKQDYKI